MELGAGVGPDASPVVAPAVPFDQKPAEVLCIEADARTAEARAESLAGFGLTVVPVTGCGPLPSTLFERDFHAVTLGRIGANRLLIEQLKTVRLRRTRPVFAAPSLIAGDDAPTACTADPIHRFAARWPRSTEDERNILVARDLSFDVLSQTIRLRGSDLVLTRMERRLLTYLMRRPLEIHAAACIIRDVLGYRSPDYVQALNVHVSRLRQKMDAPSQPTYFRNVRGLGFYFSP